MLSFFMQYRAEQALVIRLAMPLGTSSDPRESGSPKGVQGR